MTKVLNIHERRLSAPIDHVGALIDSLATPRDRLWPYHLWPRMRFDSALGVGAVGGHGPVRYAVGAYRPGRSIRFEFIAPTGFHGHHAFTAEESEGGTLLRHTLDMDVQGFSRITWPLIFRPLHDALMEDALAKAEASAGCAPTVVRWSPWVRVLRWVFAGGQARSQRTPRAEDADPPPD